MFAHFFENKKAGKTVKFGVMKSLSPSHYKKEKKKKLASYTKRPGSGRNVEVSFKRNLRRFNVSKKSKKMMLNRPSSRFVVNERTQKTPKQLKTEFKRKFDLISQRNSSKLKHLSRDKINKLTKYISKSPKKKNILSDFLHKKPQKAKLKLNNRSKVNMNENKSNVNRKPFIKPGFKFKQKLSSPKVSKLRISLNTTDFKMKDKINQLSRNFFKHVKKNDIQELNRFYKNYDKLQNNIKKNLNFNIKDKEGCKPFHFAAWNNNLKLFNFLLYVKSDIDSPNKNGITPLMLAALKGHKKILSVLVKLVPNINKQDNSGNTALHYAVVKDNLNIIKILLERSDLDFELLNNDKQKCIDLAHPSNVIKLKELLIEFTKMNEIGKREVEILSPKKKKLRLKVNNSTKVDSNIAKETKSINLDNFVVHSRIGSGSFGNVFLVEKKDTNMLYAMKVLNKKKVFKDKLKRYVVTERNVLSAIDHPFIVKLKYAFQNGDNLFLIMDYYPGGDLGAALNSEGSFEEDRARVYIAEIILALEELHNNNIIFRDLKPENIMIDAKGHIALIDFGLSKEKVTARRGARSFCGSVAYLAPEMVKKTGHGKAIDWYLLGVVLYEMMVGLPPFYAENKEQLFFNIEHGQLNFPNNFSKALKDLLGRLMERDMKKRLGAGGAKEIKKHPWFFGIDWGLVLKKKLSIIKPNISKLRLYDFEEGDDLFKSSGRGEVDIDNWTFIGDLKDQ